MQTFSRLSRRELAQTVCVHHCWQTRKGRNRLGFALRLLQDLERLGIVSLPGLQSPDIGPAEGVAAGAPHRAQPALREPLAGLVPLQLQVARGREQMLEWNKWVQRYHPPGYRQPIGPSLRYFLLDRHELEMGWLLFTPTASVPKIRYTKLQSFNRKGDCHATWTQAGAVGAQRRAARAVAGVDALDIHAARLGLAGPHRAGQRRTADQRRGRQLRRYLAAHCRQVAQPLAPAPRACA